MPRPKSFSPEEKVQLAMKLFWKKGYNNTSLTDLENITKLNRISLYHEFGSKEGLFLKSMDSFIEMMKKDLIANLGKNGIKDLITRFNRYTGKNKDFPEQLKFGCMMVNTSIESPELSEAIRKKLNKYFAFLYVKYEEAIIQAKKLNQIPKKIDSASNAKLLVTIMTGILVQIRLHKDVHSAKESAKGAIELINSWKA